LAELSREHKRALLARLLQNKAGRASRDASASEWPVTYGQRAMWLLQQLEPLSPVFVIAFAARFAEPPDVDALRKAIDALPGRHPVLTCAFLNRGDGPVAVVGAHPRPDFAIIDARGWDPQTIRSRLRDAAYRPFDLERDPLVRIRLFEGDDGMTLLLAVHHIITDLRSLQILLDELDSLYAAEAAYTPPDASPTRSDFGDYARRQAALLAGTEGERLWTYWGKRLDGELPILELVTDKPRPAVRGSSGATRRFEIPATLARQLHEFARAEGVTPYTVLLAAYFALLHRHTGREDLLVGTPVAARGGPKFERVAGYFANMVVLRADLSGDPTFRGFLRRVRKEVLGALEHQEYPFAVERLRDRLPPTDATVVNLDELESERRRGRPPAGVNPTARPDDPAYVMYTSGSTGTPKGVIGTHRAKLNTFHWMWRQFPFRLGEVCCQKTPLSFADSVQEVFGPLLAGVALVIISDADLKDPERLVAALAARRVTRIILVPSLLRAVLDAVPNVATRIPHLTLWIASGESLDLDLAERFEREFPGATLINMYGCSELSDDVTWADARGSGKRGFVPIGKPVSNLRVYVLDGKLRPVPIGVPGELCAGGVGVGPGYLNRPELTADNFIADAFVPGERMYRTGDRVRWRADGNLEYLGRIDRQVKLRGIRIEPGEIEAVLAKHPGLRQAVVTVREDVPGHPRLVAHVVPREWPGPDAAELRSFLKSRLPEPLLPAAYVRLSDLPRTPSGKVHRQALPAPTGDAAAANVAYVEPRTAAERTLAGIWAELLGVERVGAADNFFELGGESLLAVRMIARARAAALPLAPVDLFQHQTVAELAAAAESAVQTPITHAPASPHSLLVPLRQEGTEPPIFLIHPIEGTLGGYAALVRQLGTEQPVWGLRAFGLEEGEAPARTLEEMARRYLEAAMTVQPTGPYRFCGWSMGGLIAYEMARQLLERGERAAFLAVVDQRPRPDATTVAGQLCEQLLRLPLPWEKLLESATDGRIVELLGAPQIAHLLPTGVGGALPVRQLRVYLGNALTIHRYVPPAAGLRVWLYRAGSPAVAGGDATLGWAAVAERGVEVRTLPGDHHTLMRPPHVAVLAVAIRADLRAANRQ
jgi:amino acid adenylation domain-containing protein